MANGLNGHWQCISYAITQISPLTLCKFSTRTACRRVRGCPGPPRAHILQSASAATTGPWRPLCCPAWWRCTEISSFWKKAESLKRTMSPCNAWPWSWLEGCPLGMGCAPGESQLSGHPPASCPSGAAATGSANIEKLRNKLHNVKAVAKICQLTWYSDW